MKVCDMKVKVSGRKLKFPFFCKFFGKNEFLPKVSETFSDFYRDSQSKSATNITPPPFDDDDDDEDCERGGFAADVDCCAGFLWMGQSK
jgi:hypothetical protein